ncbi:enoyl-CoA hydratase/isomerase family protein [Georgenia yuyongxinii]|uniref:Enoyl-CoA hydratase/isomerase family protein n=1 Tax=Georgenia yuyongxinii TaxID=2589797 RepID=A0A552WT21_9MICO|nr:enoyl-CoA hydratase/isomerase family protein [Georgenia yuyongxinii]TRW45894.1 enoyl-CoA hydratase/isomerase family protein [Georgenia yuyongxinii]
MMALRIDEHDGIVTLTLDNAPANALDNATLRGLVAKLGEINADPTVRGVLLTGAGEKFFCAGGDVKEFAVVTRELGLERVRLGSRLKSGLAQLECPYVCAVNGAAIGSGMEMAALADFCVASETARFGMPEINHGLLPMAKGIQQLVRVMGEKNTKDVLFSGEIFSAARAHEYGLVDEVVAPDRLQERAHEWLTAMAAKPANLFRALKRTVRDAEGRTDEELERQTEEDFLSYFQTDEAAAQLRTLVGH